MRMKALSIGAITFSMFVAMLTVSAFTVLVKFAPHEPHLTVENMLTGKLYRLLLARETWFSFPSTPRAVAWFIDFRAAGLMFLMVILVLGIAKRLKVRWDHPLVALMCMFSASVPYGIGWAALSSNTLPTERAGMWLTTMLVSILYGCIACAAISAMRLYPPQFMLATAKNILIKKENPEAFIGSGI